MTTDLKQSVWAWGRRVYRLMRIKGKAAVRPQRYKAITDSNHKQGHAQDYPARNVQADAPDRK